MPPKHGEPSLPAHSSSPAYFTTKPMSSSVKYHPQTLCTHLGRGDSPKSGFINPPSTRGSTYVYPSLAEFKAAQGASMHPGGIGYGRYGSQTTRELEQSIAQLDGAYGAMITSSGFSAISTAILGCVSNGDHMLMIDCTYDPSRTFCDTTLKRMGIETSYYSADADPAQIESLIQANTRLIFVESPGSLSFEMQDLNALIETAREHQLIVIMDNTWATSINYPAISRGINISIQAATKYIGGHSDLMMGIITTDEQNWNSVRKSYIEFGHSPGTEETMLALRGLRTLPCRLKQHGESAMQIAQWLETRAEVSTVRFPALPSSPDHDLYRQQFNGPSGLFSFSLHSDDPVAIAAMVDGMQLFAIGVSWGGYESLILPADPRPIRTAKPWRDTGQLIRLSIGLEHPDDLINDLKLGFERFNLATSRV